MITYERVNEHEKDILRLLSKGFTNTEIAAHVGISPRTVKWYVSRLLLIFEASNRTELAGLAGITAPAEGKLALESAELPGAE